MKRYNWDRYWCTRDGILDLSDDGFLRDPQERTKWGLTSDYRLFSQISHFRCLGLLGEPGIGKSDSIDVEFRNLQSDSNEDRLVIKENCRDYSSEIRFVDEIFRSKELEEAIKLHKKLFIFIDALDEGLLQIKSLCGVIINELENLPKERTYLRITSRTAQWPSYFEEALINFFGESNIGIFELAPLRKLDIINALNEENINETLFLELLAQKDIVPFALKPLTLNFLIKLYLRDNGFPPTKSELFIEGIKLLCQETNQFRRTTSTASIDVSQRILISERTAGLTMFCNYSAISLNPAELMSSEKITLGEIIGGKELSGDCEVDVTENHLLEALSSGLFNSRGVTDLGWAHQSYAEMIAAKYVNRKQINKQQFLKIFTSTSINRRKIVPQLSEVVIWLASLNKEYLNIILELEPELLLRSDITQLSEEEKSKLLRKLLEFLNSKETYLDGFIYYQHLHKINHKDISAQLKPYLLDKSFDSELRYTVIEIIESCKCYDLLDDLIDLIYDDVEDYDLRTNAAYTIVNIGRKEHRLKLQRFLGSDTNQREDLKGCALKANWPEYITAEQLFKFLTPPKIRSAGGAYNSFLYDNPIKQLNIKDLSFALDWAIYQENIRGVEYTFEYMNDSITMLAWEHSDDKTILEKLAKLILKKIKNYSPILTKKTHEEIDTLLSSDIKKRRNLFLTLLKKIKNRKDNWPHLVFSSHNNFIVENDVHWLLDVALDEPDLELKRTLLFVQERIYRLDDPNLNDRIINISKSDSIVKEIYDKYLSSVLLESPLADEQKDRHEKQYGWMSVEKKELEKKEAPSKRFYIEFIEKYESGDLDSWWHLNYYD